MKAVDSPRSGEAQITQLLQSLQQGNLSRRGFIRSALLLGLSASAAQVLASCTGAQVATVPTPTYSAPVPAASPTATSITHGGLEPYEATLGAERQIHVQEPIVKQVPTYAPPSAVTPPVPTLTPVMWKGTVWSCPACLQQFGTQDELVEHVLKVHTVKVPGARQVDVGKCFQFWVMNGGSLEGLSDCANCVAACPWSQLSRPWL